MGALSDSCAKAEKERLKEIADKKGVIEALFFNKDDFRAGYKCGVMWAVAEIRKQIGECVINNELSLPRLYDMINSELLCKKR
jgi:hypothetical protein